MISFNHRVQVKDILSSDIHAHYRATCCHHIAGTNTFRLASKAMFDGTVLEVGGNLQNWRKEWRKMVVADEGKVIVQTDQSGAEALIVAYECQAGVYRDLFTYGVKPHVFVALHDFGEQLKRLEPSLEDAIDHAKTLAIKDLKSQNYWSALNKVIRDTDNLEGSRRYYYFAKKVCHLSNYDGKASRMQLAILEDSRGEVNLSLKQCEVYMDKYHVLFPEIRKWHDWVVKTVRREGKLTNLFGHPAEATQYMAYNDDLKDWIAFSPQSTVGTITHIAVCDMQDYIEDNNLDWDNIANTHDSMATQCPEGEAMECAKKQREFMEQKLLSRRGEPFTMRSETSTGVNWGPWKEDGSNPDGLKEIKF